MTTRGDARRLLHIGGWILSIGLLVWFVHHSLLDSKILYLLPWNANQIASLFALLPLYVMTLVIGSLVWWRQLCSLQGSPIAPSRVLAIGLSAQFAKYLPGNVAHHIGRVVLASKSGISTAASVFSILLESFWVMAIAASLALTFMLWFGGSAGSQWFTGMSLPLLTLAILAAAAAPYMLHRQWTAFSRRYLLRHGVSQQSLRNPSWRIAVFSMGSYLLIYVLFGLMISLLGWLFFASPMHNPLMLGSAFALAWVVGFVTPGSPAGLGIREVILFGMLSPLYGSETATGITVLLRLLTLAGDALAYLLGLLLWRVTSRAIAG